MANLTYEKIIMALLMIIKIINQPKNKNNYGKITMTKLIEDKIIMTKSTMTKLEMVK